MAFTYLGTLTTDLDKVRFKINDTVESSGPKPSGGNFTDEEINGLITLEGSVNRAVAACFETLAAIWANYVDTKIGPRDEKLSKKADNYLKLANKWRSDYGFDEDISSVTVGSINFGIDEEDDQFDIT